MEKYTNSFATFGTAILFTMFNTYFSNVVTGYSNRPEYKYCDFDKTKDYACEETNKLRDMYAYKKNVSMLVMGIICIVASIMVTQQFVGPALALSGIFTLIYATGQYWSKYNDKQRLGIVTAGLVIIIFMTSKYLPALKGQ
jgi:hypothetical protein